MSLRPNSIADAERSAAAAVENAIAQSELKTKAILDVNVDLLANRADQLIKDRINEKIDDNFKQNMAIFVAKNVQEVSSLIYKKRQLKDEIRAIFSEVIRKPLAYANVAERQARIYRYSAITLALLGLGISISSLWFHYHVYISSGHKWIDPSNFWAAIWRHAPVYSCVLT